MNIRGILVDIEKKEQRGVEILIEGGQIKDIQSRDDITGPFILPGFIDAHIHIESSMLIPSRFAYMAVQHGTVGVVTDPHEIANVAGVEGIDFMMRDGAGVPVKFFFGAPSCVPASPLEKSGAVIDAAAVERLLAREDIYYLSEMMNYPGVLENDTEVMGKLHSARKYNKPVDGHAPGLTGEALKRYVEAGISTDHECSTIEEARQKLLLGMKILIREGSAAKNFNQLIPLIKEYSHMLMLCTDDCHPDYLLEGHINRLAARAVAMGYDVYDVLRAACINPVRHYGLSLGLLQPGHNADMVLVENLTSFKVLTTIIAGEKVYDNGEVLFSLPNIKAPDFAFRSQMGTATGEVIASGNNVNIIKAVDGDLLTHRVIDSSVKGEPYRAQPDKDIIKIVLMDRYSNSGAVTAFIQGFGLTRGAIAASVAHDSHHLLAVGCDDHSINTALAWLVEHKGGMCLCSNGNVEGIPLPFFGLMTQTQGEEIARQYQQLSDAAKQLGSTLSSPFMTLSFMALTVIPSLKINHNGLFDGVKFESCPLFFTE